MVFLKPLAKIYKKALGWGMHPSDIARRATLIISNKEMNDIMKTVKSLEESGLMIKSVRKAMENEAK